MKTQCKIIQRPILKCPQCRVDIFKAGINKVTKGGSSHALITFGSTGKIIGDTCTEDITEQWSECNNCGARIDIDAIDLINYYEGECTYNDIARDDLRDANMHLIK